MPEMQTHILLIWESAAYKIYQMGQGIQEWTK